jgi:hypothetical protein
MFFILLLLLLLLGTAKYFVYGVNLNMIGVHPACVLKMLVFCNPSIHYARQVYHHFIVTTCFGPQTLKYTLTFNV